MRFLVSASLNKQCVMLYLQLQLLAEPVLPYVWVERDVPSMVQGHGHPGGACTAASQLVSISGSAASNPGWGKGSDGAARPGLGNAGSSSPQLPLMPSFVHAKKRGRGFCWCTDNLLLLIKKPIIYKLVFIGPQTLHYPDQNIQAKYEHEPF